MEEEKFVMTWKSFWKVMFFAIGLRDLDYEEKKSLEDTEEKVD